MVIIPANVIVDNSNNHPFCGEKGSAHLPCSGRPFPGKGKRGPMGSLREDAGSVQAMDVFRQCRTVKEMVVTVNDVVWFDTLVHIVI